MRIALPASIPPAMSALSISMAVSRTIGERRSIDARKCSDDQGTPPFHHRRIDCLRVRG